MENKKKTATITYHASHNYGSMLQAYALQQTLLGLGFENDIINLRTERQKSFYFDPTDSKRLSFKNRLRSLFLNLLIKEYKNGQKHKYNLFESFLVNKLKLTEEFSSIESLKTSLTDYDCYITGSDQCWNTHNGDFDWSYYLDFTDSPHKISYASSMGASVETEANNKVGDLLTKFEQISVRERGTAEALKKLYGLHTVVMPDPTFLIPAKDWSALAGDNPLVKCQYIFVYSPFTRKGTMKLALKISKKTGMPIVITNVPGKEDFFSIAFGNNVMVMLDCGPIEFLNLIKNAAFVVSGSYHALVFSIIFHSPFYAIDGMTDNRMRELLEKYGFERRGVTTDTISAILDEPMEMSFSHVDETIAKDRMRAIEFLLMSIGNK